MIHEGGDNYSDTPKPLGGGGARMACGVIPAGKSSRTAPTLSSTQTLYPDVEKQSRPFAPNAVRMRGNARTGRTPGAGFSMLRAWSGPDSWRATERRREQLGDLPDQSLRQARQGASPACWRFIFRVSASSARSCTLSATPFVKCQDAMSGPLNVRTIENPDPGVLPVLAFLLIRTALPLRRGPVLAQRARQRDPNDSAFARAACCIFSTTIGLGVDPLLARLREQDGARSFSRLRSVASVAGSARAAATRLLGERLGAAARGSRARSCR